MESNQTQAEKLAAAISGMVIIEVTGDERAETIENFLIEGEELEKLDKVFRADRPDGREDTDLNQIYFFQDKDGFYHTVVYRDSEYTESLDEMKKFVAGFWVDSDE